MRNKGTSNTQTAALNDGHPSNGPPRADSVMSMFQANRGQDISSGAKKSPRYSSAEKAWLKATYGNEFKFLRAHGLKIFKEPDRQEGERIMRSMMDRGSPEHDRLPPKPGRASLGAMEYITYDSDAEDGWRYSLPSPREEDIAVVELFVSAAPYNKTERKWLHNGYGGEKLFLRRSGLDFNDDEDREEGRRRVREMMKDDGSVEEPWIADMEREERDAVYDAVVFGTRPY